MVRKCNKTHTKSRESFLNISPGLNIVTSKAGQVFYNHTVYPACFDVTNHSLKFWSVEIAPWKAVIHIDVVKLYVWLLPDECSDKFSLTSDAVALGFYEASFAGFAVPVRDIIAVYDSIDIVVIPWKTEVHGG